MEEHKGDIAFSAGMDGLEGWEGMGWGFHKQVSMVVGSGWGFK